MPAELQRGPLTRSAPAGRLPGGRGLYPPTPHPPRAHPPWPENQIACPRGFVCIYPDINFNSQPYVKRAVDGSVRHLPDYIRGKGSSIINNSSRAARVYQKDNYFGRHRRLDPVPHRIIDH
ncbi:peptidase inhibitor family I36 protein [Streptomyces flaveolus]|uniref:peptidase inhibitor family I36 protein n=1 Tax=Streptomyces flaveolus TaxID=67297 RepID=UPI0033B24073